jgi:hypothetical protein
MRKKLKLFLEFFKYLSIVCKKKKSNQTWWNYFVYWAQGLHLNLIYYIISQTQWLQALINAHEINCTKFVISNIICSISYNEDVSFFSRSSPLLVFAYLHSVLLFYQKNFRRCRDLNHQPSGQVRYFIDLLL